MTIEPPARIFNVDPAPIPPPFDPTAEELFAPGPDTQTKSLFGDEFYNDAAFARVVDATNPFAPKSDDEPIGHAVPEDRAKVVMMAAAREWRERQTNRWMQPFAPPLTDGDTKP